MSAPARSSGSRVEKERVDAAARQYVKFARRSLRPRSDAIETLQRLRNDGYRIGLISNCGPPIPDDWPETPLAAWIDASTFSCLVGLQKPDPRIYLQTCDQLAVPPTGCLYVGDGGSDELNGATRVGMAAVLIEDRSEDVRDSDRSEVDDWSGQRIRTLSEIHSVLE